MQDQDKAKPASFTGRSRERKTRRAVIIQDRLAGAVIKVGGIATILSVIGVMAFLLSVVIPLFRQAGSRDEHKLPGSFADVVQVGVDEYQVIGWVFRTDGRIEAMKLDTGARLLEKELVPAASLASWSFSNDGRQATLGLKDGRVQLVDLDFATENMPESALPAELVAALGAGRSEVWRDGVVQKVGSEQFRFQRLTVTSQEPFQVADGEIFALAYGANAEGPLLIALAETSTGARLLQVGFSEKTDFLTGTSKLEVGLQLEIPFEARAEKPMRLALSGAGTDLFMLWADGMLDRFNLRDPAAIERLERGFLIEPGSGNSLTNFASILGGNTFLWGDSGGRLRGGFTVRPQEAQRPEEIGGLIQAQRTADTDQIFAKTKELVAASGASVGPIVASVRTRLALVGFSDGRLELLNVTNEARLWTGRVDAQSASSPILAATLAPKDDGMIAVTANGLFHSKLEVGYPEAGVSAFFRPVWYEGYPEPDHVWQSSSGTDDFEVKLGLMPLIFGTIKATFYSLLLGVPIALLAAIFTSEFLRGRARAIIKPSIEIMASLPSVVLGFLAALVIAPWVESRVPATLALVFVMPILFLLGAQFWQLLPSDLTIRYQSRRIFLLILLVPIALWVSSWVGPLFESVFFAGDFKLWLAWEPGGDTRFADPKGGFMFLLVPLSALFVALLFGRFVDPLMRTHANLWDRRRYAVVDLLKLCAGIVLTFGFALLVAAIAAALGFDPRGAYFDTYVQRNAMIVGFVMGFAIIPIIYTISEDALSTVPEHLRSASLGAGATPWQTATRIVVPTAMSGLFSAVMVGLGRAVGETMIVLMAAGNTPVMSWNLFEGFRTLSANIAVELPEAVRGGIHYRTLFLAAFVLFVLTFVVNTIAEVIRQRFRKRAYQL